MAMKAQPLLIRGIDLTKDEIIRLCLIGIVICLIILFIKPQERKGLELNNNISEEQKMQVCNMYYYEAKISLNGCENYIIRLEEIN